MIWQLLFLIAVGTIVPVLIFIGVVMSIVQSEDGARSSSPLLIGGIIWTVVAVAGTPLIYNLFRHQILQFGENLNAVVVSVQMVPTVCLEDGMCRWTYDCHPYTSIEYYTTTNSKGKQVRKSRPVIKYHACPYSSEEDTWLTVTSLKEDANTPVSNNLTITESDHRLPQMPYRHLWSEVRSIPASVIDAAGVGEPAISRQYEVLLSTGHFPAISLKTFYSNYLLSDPDTTMRPAVLEEEIQPFQAKHLLPRLTINPNAAHYIDKVYFVGMRQPTDVRQWQTVLARFNAEAGQLRQMDLHLVILPDATVGDLHQYALALWGYWADTSVFGKDALPKNAVVVVATTDGQVMKRAEVFTLMPPSSNGVSNSFLFQEIQGQLPGVPFHSETLIGNPQPIIHRVSEERYDVRYQVGPTGPGVLERLMVIGVNHFQRVPMSSFRYLEDEILPTTADCIWIVAIVFLLGLVLGSVGTGGAYKVKNL